MGIGLVFIILNVVWSSIVSSLNDELGAEPEGLVQVEEELLHGWVALDEHALGDVHHGVVADGSICGWRESWRR